MKSFMPASKHFCLSSEKLLAVTATINTGFLMALFVSYSLIFFVDHNLVTDGVFAEVNLIFCRNVLIYFDKFLQNKVLKLFNESLTKRGILCLGTKESLRFTDFEHNYSLLDKKMRIYKKIQITEK